MKKQKNSYAISDNDVVLDNAFEPCRGQLGCSTKMDRVHRYLLLSQKAGNALVAPPVLQESMDGSDYLFSGGSHARLPL
ncbi:hypothetical protein EVAR_28877_1 [Eumeta japonica]|uniref:Uncharacterized protein n=1 Tax=Eumeta variegata TaxID=151549 RepID=A0A4C1X1V0_EUMVA|nr:hypothetical protein EVAR_28877_1 [Eumeta japonica]